MLNPQVKFVTKLILMNSKPSKYTLLLNFPSLILFPIQVWLVWFYFNGGRWDVRKHAHQGTGRLDVPEWDSDGMTSYGTKSFHFISCHSILVTFDIWRNKSLQSFSLFSHSRASHNTCQGIFVPLIEITAWTCLLSLWAQEKTTEYRTNEPFLWHFFKIHSPPRVLDFLVYYPHPQYHPKLKSDLTPSTGWLAWWLIKIGCD